MLLSTYNTPSGVRTFHEPERHNIWQVITMTKLPARTTAMGWHGDVDRGGEVASSERPGRNDHAYKGTRRRRVGRRVASTCPASSDRQARAKGMVTGKWAVGLDFSTHK
jgi:hypothetical protein